MSYLDFWKFSGGDCYLAHEDDDDYIAHYGVKGMKWKEHKYKTVDNSGNYSYGLSTIHQTSPERAAFDRAHGRSSSTSSFRSRLSTIHQTSPERRQFNAQQTRKEYRKNVAKTKVKNFLNTIRGKRNTTPKQSVSNDETKSKFKSTMSTHAQQIRDKVALNKRIHSNQKTAENKPSYSGKTYYQNGKLQVTPRTIKPPRGSNPGKVSKEYLQETGKIPANRTQSPYSGKTTPGSSKEYAAENRSNTKKNTFSFSKGNSSSSNKSSVNSTSGGYFTYDPNKKKTVYKRR